jgi:hypothetical protein
MTFTSNETVCMTTAVTLVYPHNLEHAVALHFMHYNFARIHKTLICTPAMEAGVTSKLWSLEDIAELAG